VKGPSVDKDPRTRRTALAGTTRWRRALILVVGFFEVSLYIGVAMVCLGAVLVALTAGAQFSLVVLGVGVLFFLVGGGFRVV
jgi:hypothetical protein